MKIQGTYSFEAPLETVWAALFDPEVLAKTLPGCEKLEREGDQFKGEINVKMGPVQGKFQGKVDITDVLVRESYTMVIDGRGPAGFVKATAQLRVKPDTAAGAATRLDYESDVQVGGRIASVGQRLLDASSRAIVKQSLEGLHEQIKALAARTREANVASVAGGGAEPDRVASKWRGNLRSAAARRGVVRSGERGRRAASRSRRSRRSQACRGAEPARTRCEPGRLCHGSGERSHQGAIPRTDRAVGLGRSDLGMGHLPGLEVRVRMNQARDAISAREEPTMKNCLDIRGSKLGGSKPTEVRR